MEPRAKYTRCFNASRQLMPATILLSAHSIEPSKEFSNGLVIRIWLVTMITF